MALPYASALKTPSINPLFQNGPAGLSVKPFLDFLHMKQANRGMPSASINPQARIGTSPNAATFGGNLISPALRAMLGMKS